MSEKKKFVHMPMLQFISDQDKDAFKKAIIDKEQALPQSAPSYIQGREVENPLKIHSKSPASERIVCEASIATDEDLNEAIESARGQFEMWKRFGVEKRAEILKRAALWMEKNRYELAAIEVLEVGKPWREADADIVEAVDYLNYYADEAIRLQTKRITEDLKNERNTLILEPRGVAAVIAPWNFPIAIPCGMTSAALVTGNTVLLKPAEQSPLCGWQIMRAFIAAGVPRGVLQLVHGDGETVGEKIMKDPRIDIIAFTGSKEVGLHILSKANQVTEGQLSIKKVITELGGKNAAIVDETADFDQTIPAVLESAFIFGGQKCSALSRLYIMDAVYDRFVKRLIESAESICVGDPKDPLVECGPLIDKNAQIKVRKYLEIAEKDGKVIFQKRIGNEAKGYFIPPTIVADLSDDSRLWSEEVFGPLLVIKRVKNFEEAIRKLNSVEFGLTGGIFSRTPSNIERACNEAEVGNFYINREITGAVVGRQPFGGRKLSGGGTKAGGSNYLREFCYEKTISENLSRHGFSPM